MCLQVHGVSGVLESCLALDPAQLSLDELTDVLCVRADVHGATDAAQHDSMLQWAGSAADIIAAVCEHKAQSMDFRPCDHLYQTALCVLGVRLVPAPPAAASKPAAAAPAAEPAPATARSKPMPAHAHSGNEASPDKDKGGAGCTARANDNARLDAAVRAWLQMCLISLTVAVGSFGMAVPPAKAAAVFAAKWACILAHLTGVVVPILISPFLFMFPMPRPTWAHASSCILTAATAVVAITSFSIVLWAPRSSFVLEALLLPYLITFAAAILDVGSSSARTRPSSSGVHYRHRGYLVQLVAWAHRVCLLVYVRRWFTELPTQCTP